MLGINPYKKGTFGHRDKHRERRQYEETQGGDSHVIEKCCTADP